MKNYKLNIENIAATIPVVYNRTYPFNGRINFSNSHAVRDEAELDKVYELYPNATPMKNIKSVYVHNTIDGVCFNMIYQTRNVHSYGDHFIIVGTIYGKNRKIVLLKVLFENAFRSVVVPLQVFYTGQIYNPYHVRYFGCCSIGNVNILKHPQEFACWWEAINRCFNPDHPIYDIFTTYWKLNTIFTCFEDLVNMNLHLERRYGKCPLIFHPNDRLLYIQDGYLDNMIHRSQNCHMDNTKPVDPDTYRGVALLNRLKSISADTTDKFNFDKNYYMEKRIDEVSTDKHAGGRPKKRKLMYKLI